MVDDMYIVTVICRSCSRIRAFADWFYPIFLTIAFQTSTAAWSSIKKISTGTYSSAISNWNLLLLLILLPLLSTTSRLPKGKRKFLLFSFLITNFVCKFKQLLANTSEEFLGTQIEKCCNLIFSFPLQVKYSWMLEWLDKKESAAKTQSALGANTSHLNRARWPYNLETMNNRREYCLSLLEKNTASISGPFAT